MVGIMDELEGEDTIHMQIHVHLPGFLLHYMGKLQDWELERFCSFQLEIYKYMASIILNCLL